ncbi:MAG TPA: hypothetical protein VGR28_04515 [Candidatus Thermoplasmatota archaeon]|jgi:hypothetical protein|nr:hypothetical protein [Candidatus Thermoplasmatota archaeon]
MAVILAPRYARKMSAFMFSASLVGALAEAGIAGVEPKASGAESLPEGMGPLLLE